jgi:DNA transposition AAA+ family ATPase
MRSVFVETENVRRLARALDALAADDGMSRMGLVDGTVGLGKSWAIDEACTQRGCIYVRACATWTPNGMLRAILNKMGVKPSWNTVDNLEKAAGFLQARKTDYNGRDKSILIIDEADYLIAGAKPGTPPVILDTVRDLHDLAGSPVLLVGEPELFKTLDHYRTLSGKWRRLYDRILTFEHFQPLTAAEIQVVARELTGLEAPLESAELLERTEDGNLRRVVIALRVAERMAQGNSMEVLSLDLVRAAREKTAKTKRYFDKRQKSRVRKVA